MEKLGLKSLILNAQVLNPLIFGPGVVKWGINPDDDTNWSVALRGSYVGDSQSGAHYQVVIDPELTLARPVLGGRTTLSAGAAISVDENKTVRPDDIHAGVTTQFQLNEVTSLKGAIDLSLTQANAFDPSLPTNTADAPREFTGTATGSATRKLG